MHGIDAILAVKSCNRVRSAEIPVFDLLVPGAGDEDLSSVDFASLDAADGLVVDGDLLGCGAGLVEVESSSSFIGAAAEDFRTILMNVSITFRYFGCCPSRKSVSQIHALRVVETYL